MTKNEKIQAAVERILTYFSLCEAESPFAALEDVPPDQLQWMTVPLTYFNGADPAFAYPDVLGSEGLLRSHQRLFMAPEAVKWSDMNGVPYDMSMLKLSSGEDKHGQHLYFAFRVRRVPAKELRGVRLRTGQLVEYSFTTIYKNGKHTPCRYYAEMRNGQWCMIAQPHEVEDQSPVLEVDQMNINASRPIAFTDYYEWKVRLGYQGLPTIGLTTDPVGAREVFRLRDIPDGAARRAALRHWVEGYYRKSVAGSDYDAEAIKVIAHLRGATKFQWNGLQCEIMPSPFDIQRAEKLKKQKAK